MIKILKGINPEYKVAAVFAFAAMFVSLLTGVISGVKFGAVLLRTFFSILFFAGLGFGVFFVVKKYVPEFFELNTEDDPANIDLQPVEGGEPEVFTEFSGADFPNLNEAKSDIEAPSGSAEAFSGNLDLGRHIVKENSDFPYEPEIMAQAVRTMMNKDDN
ncbi:MAG: hypothetical protein FWG92_03985 [Leptospirales bacterium]|nr:hypothetical protein [Leptospirales bacterium]